MARQLTLLLIIICGHCLLGCSEKATAPAMEKLRPVRTLVVKLQDNLSRREFTGVVDADRKVDLAFRVSGTLEQLPVLEGQHVDKGQLLASLDKSDFDIVVKAAQADFNRSQGEYERAKALVKKDLLSQADFEKVQAQYYIAESQLDSARQDLAHSTLHSPFEGYIARRYVENFSAVAARNPVLTLMDLNSLVITIDVPESVMIQAQRKGVRPELYAVFQGHEEQQYPLVIKEVATQPDQGTQTYAVTLNLPPIPDLNILPGMSATVGVRPFAALKDAGQSDIAYLPSQAVMEDAKGRFVFVAVASEGEVANIERRDIKVGDISAYGIEVLSGLQEGEAVVTAGMSQIVPGQRVLLPPGSVNKKPDGEHSGQ